jgi:hypothetical protein
VLPHATAGSGSALQHQQHAHSKNGKAQPNQLKLHSCTALGELHRYTQSELQQRQPNIFTCATWLETQQLVGAAAVGAELSGARCDARQLKATLLSTPRDRHQPASFSNLYSAGGCSSHPMHHSCFVLIRLVETQRGVQNNNNNTTRTPSHPFTP